MCITRYKNKKPNENYYRIKDSSGKIIFEKDSLSTKPNTIYQDTIKLKRGNYNFNFSDRTGNGLEFWYSAKDGRGEIKLLDSLGNAIKQFDSDFGNFVNYNFSVQPDLKYELDNSPSISVFPARTKGPITLDYFSNIASKVKVQIVEQENEKNILEEHVYNNLNKGSLKYNLSYLPKMRYYIKVFINDKEVFKNRIRLKE